MSDQERLDDARRARAQARCVASGDEVAAAIVRMARDITACCATCNPIVYVALNGGVIPAGLLLAHLEFPLEVGYFHATRYGHRLHGEQIDWRVKPTLDPRGRSVLVIDDVLDEGATLEAVCRELADRGALEVRTAVLVHKLHERKARPGMRADFTGLELPDCYLFGGGMDYKGYWRNGPGIYALP